MYIVLTPTEREFKFKLNKSKKQVVYDSINKD